MDPPIGCTAKHGAPNNQNKVAWVPGCVQEVDDSRIYAGVHFRHANTVAAVLGRAVARRVWSVMQVRVCVCVSTARGATVA
jgi:hypothetical protein